MSSIWRVSSATSLSIMAIGSAPSETSLRKIANLAASLSMTLSICCLTGAKSQAACAGAAMTISVTARTMRRGRPIPDTGIPNSGVLRLFLVLSVRGGGEIARRDLPAHPSLVEQGERPDRVARRHVAEVRIAGALRIDAADAAHHRHILLAAALP